MEKNVRKSRQEFQGVVVNDSVSKTRIIQITRGFPHPLYHKKSDRHSKLMVHDAKDESKLGDVVVAVSCRPLSRRKHFRVAKVLERRTVA